MDREEAILSAVRSVQEGILSRNAAAKRYNVPRATLYNRLQGRGQHKRGCWRKKFTDGEEQYLANFLLHCADIGVPLNKPCVRKLVTSMATEKGMVAKFSDGWLSSFLRRYPDLSRRITHGVNRKKAREWTAENCEGWVTLLSELHIEGWLDDPAAIWNLDESGFSTAEKVDFVFARKGTKNVLSYYDGNDKEVITVLAGGNAAGTILRPLILYDGKMHIASRYRGTQDRCWLGVNHSGVMDTDVFLEYFEKEVLPRLTAPKNLIMLDGHSSHVYNEKFLLLCANSKQNIRVVIFPAGQTCRTQPLDLRVFGPVKRCWKNVLREKNLTVSADEVSKQNFALELMDKWEDFNMPANIQSGFREAGIYPFDPAIVCKDFPGTVPSVPSVTAMKPSDVYAKEFEEVRTAYRKIHPFSDNQIEQFLEKSKQVLDGVIPAVSPKRAAVEFKDKLCGDKPEKRRYAKDSRLCTVKGAIATESAFLDALKDRNDKKRRPLKNVTNSKKK
ncbi:uncharacterized protein LOC129598178 [Paramacrobiotus metropolitanus]|uniref:uncharacterized protein LOC129598178 n=1 Tax=Paramacrobiotus metropolitanus TaxID=2943436 RepID=UPI0024459824|nr:uncharacterized protein LOC129598178 [Paramacrobiotus metropolitanus]